MNVALSIVSVYDQVTVLSNYTKKVWHFKVNEKDNR